MLYLVISVGNMAIVKVWQDKNGPYMQALWCIDVSGSLFASLVAKPFLSNSKWTDKFPRVGKNTLEYLNANYTHDTLQVSGLNGNLSNDGLPTKDVAQESNVLYPFSYLQHWSLSLVVFSAMFILERLNKTRF